MVIPAYKPLPSPPSASRCFCSSSFSVDIAGLVSDIQLDMSNCGANKLVRRPSFERCSCSECVPDDEPDTPVETHPLLQSEEISKGPTPLPKLQVASLLLVFLPESVTSTLIYPFIVQVSKRYSRIRTHSADMTWLACRQPRRRQRRPGDRGLLFWSHCQCFDNAPLHRLSFLLFSQESCFFATEAIFVFFWARVSDKIGRKPVVLFGSLSLALALTCFGFSKTLFGVMASRALQGRYDSFSLQHWAKDLQGL